MKIHAFTTEIDRVDAFIRFEKTLYCEDTNWIPPIENTIRAQLAEAFPFYHQPGNDRQHFLAVEGREVVGRLSAMVNHALHDEHGERVGTVGFFECVEDYHVAEQLLAAAADWLHGTHHLRHVWGPMNFDIWHGYRMMTQGFDRKTFLGEPYNKPYYPGFFERIGFSPKKEWESVELGVRGLTQLLAHGSTRVEAFRTAGYRFEPFDLRSFRTELQKLYTALMESYAGFLGFTPLSFAEFEQTFGVMRQAFHPQLFAFAYDPEGRLAGFAGAFLEISDAVRAMKGRVDLVARMRFLYHRRRADRILSYIIGTLPTPSNPHTGLGRVLTTYVIKKILEAGYTRDIAALMPINTRSRGLADHARPAHRQYALYEYDL